MIDGFLELLFKASPAQQKKVGSFFARVPQAREDLATFLKTYKPIWEKPEIGGIEGLCAAYIRLLGEVMACRIEFMRTGCYNLNSQADAVQQVYNNKEQMVPYMLGLALSQYLWHSHYKLFNFYKECVKQHTASSRFLEVGCGHGLFVLYLNEQIAQESVLDVVDISKVSIDLSKDLLDATCPQALKRIRFTMSDVAVFKAETPYDFIGMGEVLEHVESPSYILNALHKLLADDGSLYITTCVNSPAIDHVFLFEHVDEIRSLVHECGFVIAQEEVIPSEESKSLDYHEKNKLDIIYGALLKKSSIER